MKVIYGVRAAHFLAVLLLLGLFPSLPAQSSPASATIRGTVHPAAVLSTDQGLLPGSTQVPNLQIYLRPSAAQQIALAQLLAAQRAADSPLYHHWLTPTQFGQQFGVSAVVEGKLRAWLKQQGFTNVALSPSRTVLTFRGTAAQVSSAFQAPIHRVSWHGAAHYSNLSNITLPQEIAPLVQSVRGLNDFHLQPQAVKVSTTKARPAFTSTGDVYGLAPGDIAAIYDLNALYNQGIDGTGMTAVVVGASDVDLSDITAFRNGFNLPSNTPSLVLVPTSSDPGTIGPEEAEADVDLELLGAVARNAQLIYVYGTDIIAAIQYAVDQHLAPVISMSYGGCEFPGVTSDNEVASLQLLAQQASTEGISVVVASGDTGAAACDAQNAKAAQWGEKVDSPANVPEITGVGGTSLAAGYQQYFGSSNDSYGASTTGYVPEIAWNTTQVGVNLQASGGGRSGMFSKPGWQQGAGVPTDGQRDVPDVAMFSTNGDMAYIICSLGDCASGPPNLSPSGGMWGGTSASTPVFAGILTLLNHYLVANHKISTPGLGTVNPNLYLLASKTTDVFHDIVQGNNVVPCASGSPDCTTGSFGFAAGQGYDQVTGLGSVDGLNLITEWSNYSFGGTSLQLTASDSPVVSGYGLNQTLTATVTTNAGSDIPTGSVMFYTYWSAGSQAQRLGTVPLDATGTATLNVSTITSGLGMIYAVYSGSLQYSESMGSLPVYYPTSVSLGYSPSGNITVGSNVTLTATVGGNVSGSLAGTVAFAVNGTQVGTESLTSASGSGTETASVSTSFLSTGQNTVTASYSGSSLYGPSTTQMNVTVSRKNTLTGLSVSPTGTLGAGESYTLTAAVTSAGSPVPGGNVTFTVGSSTYVVPVNASTGIATWTGAAASISGTWSAWATYQGTETYDQSGSNVITLAVNSIPTTTVLTISPPGGTLQAGSSYTLTATVTAPAGSPTPSGNVVFTVGTSTQVFTLNAAGVATLATTAPSIAGTFAALATYSGTSLFATSTSAVLSESVTTGPTTMTLSVNPPGGSVQAGSSFRLTATVSSRAGSPAPTGSVVFTAGTASQTVALNQAGVAAWTTTAPAVPGSLSLAASYLGGAEYSPSSIGTSETVVPIPTTTTLTASSSTVTVGSSVALTATVAPVSANGLSPVGAVSFFAGNTSIGSVPLGNGAASLNAASLPAGGNTITASFVPASGGAFSGSTSGPVTISVTDPANPLPGIRSLSPAFTTAGSAAFTLSITGTGFVTGSTVYWGPTALPTTVVSSAQMTVQVPAAAVASAGRTTITVQSPTPGGGTSNSLQFEVDSANAANGAPVFTSSSATIATGSAATFNVTVPSGATNVAVSCLNLPSGATCNYSASNSTVTITTSASTPAGSYPVTVVFSETLPGSSAGALAPFLLLPFRRRRKKNPGHQPTRAWLVLGLVAALAVIAGCGGGNTAPPPTQPVTPSTYQVSSSAVVTLNVQ